MSSAVSSVSRWSKFSRCNVLMRLKSRRCKATFSKRKTFSSPRRFALSRYIDSVPLGETRSLAYTHGSYPLESRPVSPSASLYVQRIEGWILGVCKCNAVHLQRCLQRVHLYLTRFPPLVRDRSVCTHEVDGRLTWRVSVYMHACKRVRATDEGALPQRSEVVLR